jgi:membrane protein
MRFANLDRPLPWRELLRRTVADTFEDGCPGLAAQLAFYFLLALFPALLFLVSLLAYLPVSANLDPALAQLEAILPEEVLIVVRGQIDDLLTGRRGGLLTLAIAGALWSSSSALTAIITALNLAFDIDEWRPWWKRRLVGIALTIALAVFVAAAFIIVVGGADLADWLALQLGAGRRFAQAWSLLQWPLAFALVVTAVDFVYHFAPNTRTEWAWVTPGALLATMMWILTSLGFKLYIEHVGAYNVAHGAIGTVIVLMLWFYLSGFALLIGAELNGEIHREFRARARA